LAMQLPHLVPPPLYAVPVQQERLPRQAPPVPTAVPTAVPAAAPVPPAPAPAAALSVAAMAEQAPVRAEPLVPETKPVQALRIAEPAGELPRAGGKPVISLKLSHQLSVPLAAPLAMAPLKSAPVGYSVQVYSLQYAGRFTPDVVAGLKKRFERSLQSWQDRGYTPYLHKTDLPDGNVEIAICIGNFGRPDDAAMLADQIRALGQPIAMVVPVNLHGNGKPAPIDAHVARTTALPNPARPPAAAPARALAFVPEQAAVHIKQSHTLTMAGARQ
jgi:hypothetical protein